RVDMATLMEQIFQDRSSGLSSGLIAFKFHNSLAHLIEKIAEKKQIKHLAFSGGVFQNSLLVDLITQRLEKNYKLFFHQEMSPNDENISFGQLAYYAFFYGE
ncbi:MAG: hypothetical protein KDC53_09430, partial [Saprospiraceae bacterium]|nr:hypothetical protein [Saprospiraceae bacterium]